MYYGKLDHFYNKRFKYRKVYLQKYLIVENNQGSMISIHLNMLIYACSGTHHTATYLFSYYVRGRCDTRQIF